jgi:signal transduction histidine kinase
MSQRDDLKEAIDKLQSLNDVKDKAMRNLSHDMRNALSNIIGMAAMISEEQDLSLEEIRKMAQVIQRNGMNLKMMVDNMLDTERLAKGKIDLKLEPVSVNYLLEQMREDHLFSARQKNILLRIHPYSDELFIRVDRIRLIQVLNNLINNAIKFTNPGGRIDLEADLTQNNEDSEVTITVRDNGIGIPEEYIPRIFNKFGMHHRPGTRKEQGIGLGLSVVKQLVDLHDGQIEVASEEGEGSEFTLTLPLYDRQTQEKEATPTV